MMIKKIKTVLTLLVAGILFTGVVPVRAEGTTADGSITVKMEYRASDDEHIKIDEGKLSLYKFKDSDGNLTTNFVGCDLDATATTISDYVSKKTIIADDTVNISDGKVYFSSLSDGTYLIKQTETAKGYSPIESILVTLPCENEDYEGNNAIVSPKVEKNVTHSITVKKVVEGNMGNKSKKFNISIQSDELADETLKDSDGNDIKFDKDGSYTFKLANGESFSIPKASEGITYTVVEDDYSEDGYITTYDNQKIVLVEDTTTTVTNTRNIALPTGRNEQWISTLIGLACLAGISFATIKTLRKKEK